METTGMKDGGYELFVDGNEIILVAQEVRKSLLKENGVYQEDGCLKKRFPRSRFFFLSDEISDAKKRFKDLCDFSFGMSGYSALDTERCRALNIREGQYEAALAGLMRRGIKKIRERTPAVRNGVVYGSSACGVDLVIEKIADEYHLAILGTTCLAYLWYVDSKKEGPDICISLTKKEYCEAYVGMTDLLLAANGGETSYKMDVHAATEAFIPVVPIDVLSMLGATVPAFIVDSNGKQKVNDAVRALTTVWRLLDWTHSNQTFVQDRFNIVAEQFSDALVARVREVAPPKYSFL